MRRRGRRRRGCRRGPGRPAPSGRATVTRRDDARARSLVSLLLADSAEFAALWDLHDVAVMRRRRKRIRHPQVGLLEFDCQFLVDEDRSQILALFSPVPGSATAERLTLLALTHSPARPATLTGE
ncbi:hypothetical protein O7635_01790 [Asanoa sp. WMMD1127]|uniref:MmyB family transcriptional regulator n=1 Tax=Asanoa sp. WMMD1127 TaxID=3016107 RepID=UPI002417AA62|nr:hypothetical protein [Asanoa sp. WMMD1127]MDG4820582.1 hypothetical protein [Asanoa sp. WMMD1127]